MLEILLTYVGQHWLLSTYFSVMVLNESAILAAFALSADQGMSRIGGVALAALAGSFTNDIILYVLARYGLSRFSVRSESEDAPREEAVFERLFLKNIFLSLLFIKFLFGVRILLTIYLVVKKQIPFRLFALYDLAGVLLYILVVGSVGVLVGSGNHEVEDHYSFIVRIVTAITLSVLTFRLIGLFVERWARNRTSSQKKNSQAG